MARQELAINRRSIRGVQRAATKTHLSGRVQVGRHRTAWKLIGPILLASLLLVVAPTMAAASSVTQTRETVRETVTWTLPADQCAQLPAGVSVEGTGQRVMHIRTKSSADGTSRVRIKDVVIGTAQDSLGREYHFVYRNFSIEDRPATGSGLPTEVHMFDEFVMRDLHGIKVLRISFNWRWTYTTAVWPPEDNLKTMFTRGDPYTCDPI